MVVAVQASNSQGLLPSQRGKSLAGIRLQLQEHPPQPSTRPDDTAGQINQPREKVQQSQQVLY